MSSVSGVSGVSGETGDTGDTTKVTSTARVTLDAWRERGADRLDPVRFLFMEALDRRTASHAGATRRLLDEKLSGLMEAYARDVELAGAGAGVANNSATAVSAEPVRGALAGLTDYIASHAQANGRDPATANTVPGHSPYPDLEVLDYFRQTWSKVRSEKQLRQSLKKAPGNAGPLNSGSLVHRSLSLMRELSPGYLQQFLSYVDALSWMEQMNSSGALPAKDAQRAATARKNARNKTR